MGSKKTFRPYLVQSTNKRGGKCWKGILTYTEPNPDYEAKPDGVDTRLPSQKKRTIRRNKSKRFDSEKVKTKAQANKALAAWQSELEAAQDASAQTDNSIRAYLDKYLDTQAVNLEASTVKGYRTLTKIISSFFGNEKLAALTGADIDAFTAELRKQGKSRATVAKCYKLLKRVCIEAVRKGDLAANPFDKATPPKSPQASPNALTDAAYNRLVDLLEGMESTPLKVSCYLALYCGLRAGEICALRWGDVDWGRRTLRVQRAIGRATGENATYVKEPKTGSSRRTLPLSEEVAALLRARLDAVRVDLMLAGIPVEREELDGLYIVGSVDGRYLNPDILSREYKALSNGFNLMGSQERLTTFHDLRHSFATVAVAEGADVKSVASFLGHANAAMTLNVYADADQEAKRRAAEKVERAWKDKRVR